MSNDFCLIHGREHMRSTMGNPIAWCEACENDRKRRRIVMEEGCATCAELARGSFGPSHDPSPRCERGKRPHCTCDICF
jgi:hypothetical protein